MKIGVIGTGGVGGYFGGRLALSGQNVTFLARGKHLKAIESNGLTIKSINGDFQIDSAQTTGSLENLGKQDLILLGTKAWQLKEVARDLVPILSNESIVLPLQNGIEAINELCEHIPPQHVIGGLCRIICKIESPGVINHFAVDPQVTIGEIDNANSDRINKLSKIFNQSGIKTNVAKDIDAELWKKFIAICIGGLLAVTRGTFGEIRSLPETRQLMIDLLTEIYELSQKAEINIDPDYVEKTVTFVDTIPPESTSSLARDIWDGNPSEIEYHNGTVVKMAEKFGLEVPVNRFIYHSVLLMERNART